MVPRHELIYEFVYDDREGKEQHARITFTQDPATVPLPEFRNMVEAMLAHHPTMYLRSAITVREYEPDEVLGMED